MKSYAYKHIHICILNIAFISALFFSIPNANAKLITFKYEGVITLAQMEVSRIVDAFQLERPDVITGYRAGDKFSGEFTFESEFPHLDNAQGFYFYGNVITNMSFVSGHNGAISHGGVDRPHFRGRNTVNATNGTIVYDAAGDDGIYYNSDNRALWAGVKKALRKSLLKSIN